MFTRATAPRPGVVRARRGLASALRAQTEAAAAAGGEPREESAARVARREAIGAALMWGWGLSVAVAQADDGVLAASKLYSLPTSYGCKVTGRARDGWRARAHARREAPPSAHRRACPSVRGRGRSPAPDRARHHPTRAAASVQVSSDVEGRQDPGQQAPVRPRGQARQQGRQREHKGDGRQDQRQFIGRVRDAGGGG